MLKLFKETFFIRKTLGNALLKNQNYKKNRYNYSSRSCGHWRFSLRIGLPGRVRVCWTNVLGWYLRKEWNHHAGKDRTHKMGHL